MPDPTRPVAGAPIDTDWGQQIHDRVFQPKGTRVSGDVQAIGLTYVQVNLHNVIDDPAGWLSSDTLTVPSGAGGLYMWNIRLSADTGEVGTFTQFQIRLNGSYLVGFQMENNGGTTEFVAQTSFDEVSAGDTIEIWSRKTGGTGNPDVTVLQFSWIIQGTSIGA